MSIYHEHYADAINKLSEAYLTPAYPEARENFFKVFEEIAAAGCIGLVENERPEPENPEVYVDEEILADFARMVEILRRVNYPWADRWEQDYRLLKSDFICTPA